jgi:Zn-finger nucleic acid-binding protein
MSTIDKVCGSGWIDMQELNKFLQMCGVRKTGNGERENATDGEASWICEASYGEEYTASANYYSGESWRALLEWAEKKKPNATITGRGDAAENLTKD